MSLENVSITVCQRCGSYLAAVMDRASAVSFAVRALQVLRETYHTISRRRRYFHSALGGGISQSPLEFYRLMEQH